MGILLTFLFCASQHVEIADGTSNHIAIVRVFKTEIKCLKNCPRLIILFSWRICLVLEVINILTFALNILSFAIFGNSNLRCKNYVCLGDKISLYLPMQKICFSKFIRAEILHSPACVPSTMEPDRCSRVFLIQ
jgi:hypothetical protein